VTNKTMIGLQPETPIPLSRPSQSVVRPRPQRVFLGTPVHIPPPRRVQRAPSEPSNAAKAWAAIVVCYLIAFALAASVWL
jgi:hypothetical protein